MGSALVIDDCKFSRTALRLMLEACDYHVTEASGGIEGEALFFSSPVDIIFTDIFMPDQDGLQTAINIRRKNKAVPIVALSSGGTEGDLDYLEYAKKIGATYAAKKPILAESLLKLLPAVGSDAARQAGA